MSAKPFFTIIVSGYQNAPYLPQCLSSIANQTYGDFEVICYVEESTDNSLAICQEWARRDSRFIVVPAPQSGSGSVGRNYGIDHANGKYLVAVDGDDWIAPDMLEKLFRELYTIGSVDVLSFAALMVPFSQNATSKIPKRITNFDSTIAHYCITGIETIRKIWNQNVSFVYAQSWLNIYNVSFLRQNKIYQRPARFLEDFEWFPRVLYFAKKVTYLNATFYYYRLHSQSATQAKTDKVAYDMASQFTSFMAFIHVNPIPKDILIIWSNQWLWLFFKVVAYHMENFRDKEYKAILKAFFSNPFPKDFWHFLLNASWHNILPLPLLWLASKGWLFPAGLYFHKIYPKLEWRFQHKFFPFR